MSPFKTVMESKIKVDVLQESSFDSFTEEANFSVRELDRIRRRFARFTNPETNTMNLEGFRTIMKAYNACDPDDVDSFFRAFDRRGVGMLSCDDFVWGSCASDPSTVHILNSHTGYERSLYIFNFYDSNRSLTWEFSEFQRMIADSSITFRPGSGERIPISPEAARRIAVEKARELQCLDEENGYLHFSCIRFKKFYDYVLSEKIRGTSRLFRLRTSLATPNTEGQFVSEAQHIMANNTSAGHTTTLVVDSKCKNSVPLSDPSTSLVEENHNHETTHRHETIMTGTTSAFQNTASTPSVVNLSANNQNIINKLKVATVKTGDQKSTTSYLVNIPIPSSGPSTSDHHLSSSVAERPVSSPPITSASIKPSPNFISNVNQPAITRSTGVSKTRLHRWLHDRAADMVVDALAGQSLHQILTLRDHLGLSGDKNLLTSLEGTQVPLKLLFRLSTILCSISKSPPILAFLKKKKPELLSNNGILSASSSSPFNSPITSSPAIMAENLRIQFLTTLAHLLPVLRPIIGPSWSAHSEPEPARMAAPPLQPSSLDPQEISRILHCAFKSTTDVNPFIPSQPSVQSSINASDFEFARAFASSVARMALDTSHGGSVARAARNILTGVFNSDDIISQPNHTIDCARACSVGRSLDTRAVFCCSQGVEDGALRPFHLFASVSKLISFLRVGAAYLRKSDDSMPISLFSTTNSSAPLVTQIDAPCRVMGSVHGQLAEVLTVLRMGVVSAGGGNDLPYASSTGGSNAPSGVPEEQFAASNGPTSTVGLITMGDYFGRDATGGYGLEILIVLLALRMRGGKRVVLMRGPSEGKNVIYSKHFRESLKVRLFGDGASSSKDATPRLLIDPSDSVDGALDRIINAIWEVFEAMPLSCLVGGQTFIANLGVSDATGVLFKQVGSMDRLINILKDDIHVSSRVSKRPSGVSSEDATNNSNGVVCPTPSTSDTQIKENFIRAIFDHSSGDKWSKCRSKEDIQKVTEHIDNACQNSTVHTMITSGVAVPEGFLVMSSSTCCIFTAANYADAIINDAAIAVILNPLNMSLENENNGESVKFSEDKFDHLARITFARFHTPAPTHLLDHPELLLMCGSTSATCEKQTDLPPYFLCRYILTDKHHPPPFLFFRHHFSGEPLGSLLPAETSVVVSDDQLFKKTKSVFLIASGQNHTMIDNPMRPPTHIPPIRLLPLHIAPPLRLSSNSPMPTMQQHISTIQNSKNTANDHVYVQQSNNNLLMPNHQTLLNTNTSAFIDIKQDPANSLDGNNFFNVQTNIPSSPIPHLSTFRLEMSPDVQKDNGDLNTNFTKESSKSRHLIISAASPVTASLTNPSTLTKSMANNLQDRPGRISSSQSHALPVPKKKGVMLPTREKK